MRPLRAGILNVWEYDDQEFWFSAGRLILRGQNTAGKSKALELLFPFVLDGDTRPQRLDPFGSVSKTMYWNLIDFSDRDSAIGYCWAEFGRLDDDGEEHYVTAIVGMRAHRSAGKRVETWFAVTRARIGLDLNLAPAQVPLTAERFRATLPDRSVASTTARDHRAAVDHALFGLGQERYDALLHLLLQLRRPKLSEKLDMTRLGDYLSDALPPLEQHRMERLSTAFARLDEEAAALERLEASREELHTFLESYRAHARVHTRLRADDVRSANTQFDRVTEVERKQRETHQYALSELTTVEERRSELADKVIRVTGQLDGLDLSKVHALAEVEKRAVSAETTSRIHEARAAQDRGAAERDRNRVTRSDEVATGKVTRRDGRLRDAAATSFAAGVQQEHELHAAQLLSDPDGAQVALRGVAGRRESLLRQVRAAAEAARSVRTRIASERQASDAFDAALEGSRAGLVEAEQELEAAVADLLRSLAAWSAEWGIEVPEHIADAVSSGMPSAENRVTARPLLVAARATVATARSSAEGTRAVVACRRAEAVNARTAVEAETDMAPPARPGHPDERPAGCAPLWACVDFDRSLSLVEEAGLEAGLEASGALDALVAPDRRLLDPETLDTWVRPSELSASPGVSGLMPAPSGPIEPAVVQRALGFLGAAGSWDLDGRWALGPLQGRWSKRSADYIGAAARAEARRRRIAELDAAIAAADTELGFIGARLSALDAESGRLDAAESDWPTTARLRDARRDRDRHADAVEAAATAAEAARTRLEQAQAEGQDAIQALATAERRAGCQADQIDEALATVARYREALSDALEAVRASADAVAVADTDRTRAEEAETRAAASSEEAAAASALAQAGRAEADELRRTSGADAEAVLARQRDLREVLAQSKEEDEALSSRRDLARDQVATAEALLRAAEQQRADRGEIRAKALVRLAELAGTELAFLAIGPVDVERDLRQVTAGLGFARAAYERASATLPLTSLPSTLWPPASIRERQPSSPVSVSTSTRISTPATGSRSATRPSTVARWACRSCRHRWTSRYTAAKRRSPSRNAS